MRFWAEDLLHFWFHKLGPGDWFGSSPEVDAELRRRFGGWLESLANQRPQSFLTNTRTARAAVLLFDQVPRNLFRGEARAFACDPLARAVMRGFLARGWDRSLSLHEAQFVLMPLMHSEHIADQHLSLRRFAALGDAFILGFARDHYRMIARFGRFPHRNEVLGRTSTPAERQAVEAGHAW
ncbi:MAG: DUF924 domain-containing protein [Novosphingobium sp.]|nr:DUF924 domain-containing protein [Novosphingobium sp.]